MAGAGSHEHKFALPLDLGRQRSAIRAGTNGLVRPATVDELQPKRSSGLMTSLRILTWCCIILLAALSLLPARAFAALSLLPTIKMVRGIVPAPLGHFVAYTVAGALSMAVYGRRRGGVLIIGGFWVYAAVLEYLQHFSPGRYPSIMSFVGSALGALFGGLVIALLWHHRSSRCGNERRPRSPRGNGRQHQSRSSGKRQKSP